MEKIETKKVEKEERKHKFYCDVCNKFLGESIEYEDGYYEEYGDIEHKIFIHRTNYIIKMNLCEECYQKKMNEIEEAIKKVGYVKY